MPFPKRDRKVEAAKRMIREAFEDLERAISPTDSNDFGSATLESVQKAALDIENQLAARSSLRNMRRLMPLFSGLQHYSSAVEVLCNGTPYLPWIWAPIKLILKIASDYVEAFEQIIKAYSRIGESLNRFRVLDATFSQNAGFQLTVAVFYADILRFHKQAYTFVRRSCWKLLFLTSWGRFQRRFDNIIDDLKRHEEQIDKEANAHHIAEARDTRDKLEAWRQEALAKLARDEEEQTAGHLQTISTWLKLDDTDQVAMFDKLSTEGTRYPETCGWVLKNSTMISWLKPQPDPPFVWLQGNPGTGKSTIVGKLATFLRASPKSLVVTHFCTSSYASSTQYDRILRSLLFQLVHANDDLIAHIYWEYVVCKKVASITTLEQLMATVVTTLLGEPGQSQPIHVFLDGLDEVEAGKQRQVVSLIRKVASGAKARGAVFKVLVSCRTSPLLEKVLRKQPVVSLSDEKECLEEAISTYASHRLTADAYKLSQLGLRGSDLTHLGRSVARKADGMFLWARLVLDYLASNIFHNRHEITAAIDTLPRELSEFYERILTNTISNFDPRSVDRMRQILGWIAFAKRPLRKSEFRSALSFSAGDPKVDELVPSYIFDMCAPLIEQRRDSSFTFIHVSVKDYLETPQSKLLIAEDKVIREHSIASVTCLLSGLKVFQPDYPHFGRCLRVLKGLHGFHIYATEYWVDYILFIVTSPNALSQPDLLPSVLNDLSKNLESLGESFNAFDDKDNSTLSENGLDLLKAYKGLHASAIAALEARSRKALGGELEDEGSAVDLEQVKELRDVLVNYQATIKSLLLIQDFPGVTPEELELFKREFRTSAYTCRLPSCPRATAGFDTNGLRLQHEATHSQRLQCLYPGCQYPPFASTRALKNHENKCHKMAQGRKTIRRVAAWSQHNPEGGRQAEGGNMQQSINQQALAQQLAQQVNNPSGAPMEQQQSMNPSPQTHPLPGLEALFTPIDQHPMQIANATNVPIPGVRGPTPQEIINIRNHPSRKMAQATDEQIRTFFVRNLQAHMQQQQQMTPQQLQLQQQKTLRRMQMQQQQRINQQNGLQLQQPGQALQNPNIAMPATAVMPAQIPQQKQYQPGPELPNSNASAGNAARAARPQSAAGDQAQDSSPAPPAQNLTHAGQLNQDPHARYWTILREEAGRAQQMFRAIPMSPETNAATVELLIAIVPVLNNIERVALQWYLVTLDDVGLRNYVQCRLRLAKQFHDGLAMTQLKGAFSVMPKDIEAARQMFNGMVADLSARCVPPRSPIRATW